MGADLLDHHIVIAHILLHRFVRAHLLECIAILSALRTGYKVPFGRDRGLLGKAAPLTLGLFLVRSKSIPRLSLRLVHSSLSLGQFEFARFNYYK